VAAGTIWMERSSRELSPEQPFDEFLSGQSEVLGHVAQDTGQRPNPKRRVAWNGDVMLATFGGGQSEVASRLAGGPVAEVSEGIG
jgi:hypothetical protein